MRGGNIELKRKLEVELSSNFFVITKVSNLRINETEIIPFLILKENWNDYYEQLIIELRKSPKLSIDELNMRETLSYLISNDNQLSNFVRGKCPKINIKDILERQIIWCELI